MNVHWHKWPEERPPTETPLLMLFMDRWLREDAQRQIGIGRFYSFPKDREGDVFWLASAWTTLQCIRETEPQRRIEIMAWDVIEEDAA